MEFNLKKKKKKKKNKKKKKPVKNTYTTGIHKPWINAHMTPIKIKIFSNPFEYL